MSLCIVHGHVHPEHDPYRLDYKFLSITVPCVWCRTGLFVVYSRFTSFCRDTGGQARPFCRENILPLYNLGGSNPSRVNSRGMHERLSATNAWFLQVPWQNIRNSAPLLSMSHPCFNFFVTMTSPTSCGRRHAHPQPNQQCSITRLFVKQSAKRNPTTSCGSKIVTNPWSNRLRNGISPNQGEMIMLRFVLINI